MTRNDMNISIIRYKKWVTLFFFTENSFLLQTVVTISTFGETIEGIKQMFKVSTQKIL